LAVQLGKIANDLAIDLWYLLLEDAAVLLKKILALHTVLAGESTQHDHGISAGEGGLHNNIASVLGLSCFVSNFVNQPYFPLNTEP